MEVGELSRQVAESGPLRVVDLSRHKQPTRSCLLQALNRQSSSLNRKMGKARMRWSWGSSPPGCLLSSNFQSKLIGRVNTIRLTGWTMRFSFPHNFRGNVTAFVPHKAFDLILEGQLAFEEVFVVHRVEDGEGEDAVEVGELSRQVASSSLLY